MGNDPFEGNRSDWKKHLKIDSPTRRVFFLGFGTNCTCLESDGPHCIDLITNAVPALSDSRNWPDHWNNGVFEETCQRWARSFRWQGTLDFDEDYYYSHGFDTWGSRGGEPALRVWMNQWPLPIGWRSLAFCIEKGVFPKNSKPQQLLNMVPFEDTEFAAMIAWGDFEGTRCTFFALAEPVFNDQGEIEGFKGGGDRILISGPLSFSPELTRFASGASRWWGQFSGLPVHRGRPVGTTDRPLDEYKLKIQILARELESKAPSLDKFVERWGIPEKTVKRNLSSWGLGPWTRFRDWALSAEG